MNRTHEQFYYDQYWSMYPNPLTYLWAKNIKPNSNSFVLYYVKNDVISYFKYEIKNTQSYSVIPLYDHLKKTYTVVLTDYPYIFKNGNDMVIDDTQINVVRTPNGNLYLTGIAHNYKGVELSYIVLNVKNDKLLYMSKDLKQDDHIAAYGYTKPIANSFVVIVRVRKHKINIKVVDLIKENIKELNYDISKYMLTQYNISGQEIYYSRVREAGSYEIHKTNNGTVFYKKCELVVDIYALDRIRIFTLLVSYESNKIVVSLESEAENTNVLMRREYPIEAQYDISKSYLYAVLFSAGDYTLMKTNSMWIGAGLNLYYKDKLYASNSYSPNDLTLKNYEDLLILKGKFRDFDKEEYELQSLLMCLIQKQKINKIINKKYYILSIEKGSIELLNINDILSSAWDNNNSEIFLDASRLVKTINLNDVITNSLKTLTNSLKTQLNTGCHIETDRTLGQLHSSSGDLYLVVFVYCPKEVTYKVLFFTSNVRDLLSRHKILKLISGFEITPSKFNPNSPDFKRIANMIYLLHKNYDFWNKLKNMFHGSRGIDLISNDVVTTNLGINKVYYDMMFNRFSEQTASEVGNVVCALHVVKTITLIASEVQNQTVEL